MVLDGNSLEDRQGAENVGQVRCPLASVKLGRRDRDPVDLVLAPIFDEVMRVAYQEVLGCPLVRRLPEVEAPGAVGGTLHLQQTPDGVSSLQAVDAQVAGVDPFSFRAHDGDEVTSDPPTISWRRDLKPAHERAGRPPERVIALRHTQNGVAERRNADDRTARPRIVPDEVMEIAPRRLLVGYRPLQARVTPDVLKPDARDLVACVEFNQFQNRADYRADIVTLSRRSQHPVGKIRAVCKQSGNALPFHLGDEGRNRRGEQLIRECELEGVAQLRLRVRGILSGENHDGRKDIDPVVVGARAPALENQVAKDTKRGKVEDGWLEIVFTEA